MKKKLFAVLAATLAGATLSLTACSSGESKIIFKNYWNYDTEYTSNAEIDETLVYEVLFTPVNSGAINYGLNYKGEYTTHLVSQTKDTYLFTSVLDIDVTFTVGQNSETKKDRVETSVLFYKAGGEDNLRPISSHKKIVSHTPAVNNSVSAIKDAYHLYDYEFTTTYEDNGNAVCVAKERAYTTDYSDSIVLEKSYPFSANAKCSVLDNEQFPVAFRAMPAGTTTKVQMFNPFIGHSQKYSVSVSNETKEKQYDFKLNGTDVKRTIKYSTASICVDGTSSGQPQWAEIAALQDVHNNSNRNIMLYYCAPLSNYIGSLNYLLVSADYK